MRKEKDPVIQEIAKDVNQIVLLEALAHLNLKLKKNQQPQDLQATLHIRILNHKKGPKGKNLIKANKNLQRKISDFL